MPATTKGQPSTNDKTPPLRTPRWYVPAICLVLAAITFAVFGQTYYHEFINFDDSDYVYENPVVAAGLTPKGIVWSFTRVHSSNWHPLTWISHMLDCQLYGLNPGGHHLTSVLLHTVAVLLLFLGLRRVTGALWRSAFVAAVFAIHPLRVESVAWVAERKDVLSGVFFMLTIGAYFHYARPPRSLGRYGLVLLLFALGLMCKPMLVTLPLVLLLLDYWPLQRPESAGWLVIEKLPLLALSAASCATTLFAQTEAVRWGLPLARSDRLGNALVTGMVYLGQMVYPARLAAFYPYPPGGLPTWEVALAAILLAGISALAWMARRTRPWLLIGWVWYLVMLLPVVGLIQVGTQAHADRYTYLPQIGIYVAVTWLLAEWKVSRMLMGSLMTGALGVLAFCASQQTAYWQDSETLWTRTIACTTTNEVTHFLLGDALRQEGRVDEAITHYQMALQISPAYADVHYDLGLALDQKGELDEAIAQFQLALQNKPKDLEAHNNLGNDLLKKGKVDEAITHYQTALQINPAYVEAQFNLGLAFAQKGNLSEAITHYQSAMQLGLDTAAVHLKLGLALERIGRADEAIAECQLALQINPSFAEAHYSLASILQQKGRLPGAVEHYQKALQFNPANVPAENNLAWILATTPDASLRNGAKAVELAQRADALTRGASPTVLDTLAAAFAEAGRFSDAVRAAQKALALAQSAGKTNLVNELNGELKLYQAGVPCRQ